ncbi:3-deoxy-manno-octulosonate cytidylyltransferase [Pectinatus cerevisiiphilus]|uniref:3-deoxy-manno-octulosonate cytidylyltransferase n=1 Tax=Pectinatus cerevisiiphilus TaxID=86956 RepID=A0A4V2US86_9FIRM|nr:3-deoxy-manno-octulosonate cytidylyltransferase [Pectinatus cerevisiiphilus]TCS80482.1 3-deoxy-manno-octulosonate cytidylyltransferase (CMP-KDO synthetase) [Pectinatus cerevisiiphilus]
MKIICIIPARFSSTRLPGKPLADVAGKPLIVRVYEQAIKASVPTDFIVAVDDVRIFKAVEAAGGKAVMTRQDHLTGTDRLAEAAAHYPDADVIINIQGDEPLIDPELIDRLGNLFITNENLDMATVMTPMLEEEKNEPGNVKVVTDQKGYAIYFSRALIPYPRNDTAVPVYKHIGIYAYKRAFLLKYAQMAPTPLEKTESLEQLRAIENGYKIKVITSDKRFIGVDTPEDLIKVNEYYRTKEGRK